MRLPWGTAWVGLLGPGRFRGTAPNLLAISPGSVAH